MASGVRFRPIDHIRQYERNHLIPRGEEVISAIFNDRHIGFVTCRTDESGTHRFRHYIAANGTSNFQTPSGLLRTCNIGLVAFAEDRSGRIIYWD